MLPNVNGISREAAKKLQICLLCIGTSRFVLITRMFKCLEPGTTQSHR